MMTVFLLQIRNPFLHSLFYGSVLLLHSSSSACLCHGFFWLVNRWNLWHLSTYIVECLGSMSCGSWNLGSLVLSVHTHRRRILQIVWTRQPKFRESYSRPATPIDTVLHFEQMPCDMFLVSYWKSCWVYVALRDVHPHYDSMYWMLSHRQTSHWWFMIKLFATMGCHITATIYN